MEIAHISDLHFGISSYHDRGNERVLQEVAGSRMDHLIITGDVTNSGRDEEYLRAAEALKKYGLLSSERLTVIPGNHDLYSPFFHHFTTPEHVYRNFAGISRYFRFILGYGLSNYRHDLKKFNSHFTPAFEGVIKDKYNFGGYPFIKVLNNEAAIIGLDSNALPGLLHNPSCSNGICDNQDYRALKQILGREELKGKIKIAAMHNYLYSYEQVLSTSNRWFARFMETKKVERYIALFDMFNVDLVLHGHYHFNDRYLAGKTGINVINGGGTRWGKWNRIIIKEGKVKYG